MATPILKVITEYCAVYVDDERKQQLAEENQPLYARQMWGLFQAAIPFFTIPDEMYEYLVGTYEKPKLIAPIYESKIYVVENDLTEDLIVPQFATIPLAVVDTAIDTEIGGEVVVEPVQEYIGYELFNCQLQELNDFGDVILNPTNAVSYNHDNGEITIHATPEQPIVKGTIYNMDFYTDGEFEENLSGEIMRILGMCFNVVWQMRFNNDWLSNVPKVEDKSFYEQNRANKMKVDGERLRQLLTDLASAMRRYEQKLHYRKLFPTGRGLI